MNKKITSKFTPRRIESLDYLRGFFIIVIIIDHLWKFPSLWTYITGEARLWMTAAEGFVIISGFLIGYIRGFKGLRHSFGSISFKLIKRAVLLYVWMLIVSMAYVWLEWNQLVPNMPYTIIEPVHRATYWDAFVQFATTGKPHVWIHFLYLYAVFLALAPIAVGLLRKRQPWLLAITTLIVYFFGLLWDVQWMKWQTIFFLPSIAGFYFEDIQRWWANISAQLRKRIEHGIYSLTLITLTMSSIVAFHGYLLPSEIVSWSDGIFAGEVFSPYKIVIVALWFVALALLFERITPFLKRYTFNIVAYLGTHSLTAYVVHGFAICFVNAFLMFNIPQPAIFPYFTLLGLIAILLTYLVIRAPILRSILPK